MKPVVHVFPDAEEMSRRAAEAVARSLRAAAERAGRCSLLLSGGTTPRRLYALLATEWRDQVPWARVEVFWGDERLVPSGDPRSNYRMAREALLDHVPCPAANIHPVRTGFADPADAARSYETTLRGFFREAWPRFDLALLGLGADGHTASIFPGSPALDEPARWVMAVTAPAAPPARLTLTVPALARSAETYFLVTGSSKADALRQVFSGRADPRAYPAAAIRPDSGRTTWWVDREAAAGMSTSAPSSEQP